MDIRKEYDIVNLHCGGCALKVETAIDKMDFIKDVSLNFLTKKVVIKTNRKDSTKLLLELNDLVDKLEPGVKLVDPLINKKQKLKVEYDIINLHCGGCAIKIEKALEETPHFQSVNVNFLKKKVVGILSEEAPLNVVNIISDLAGSIEPGVTIEEKKVETYSSSKEKYSDPIEKKEEKNHDSNTGKKELLKLTFGIFVFSVSLFLGEELSWVPYLLGTAYIVVGWDVVYNAFNNLRRGAFLDENFLMTIATFGAFFIGESAEAVGVMLFYKVGEYFQGKAVNNSRKSIEKLMDIRPDFANVKTKNGIRKVDPTTVEVGDIIVVKAGEKLPLDGVIKKGRAALDTSALTGESLPRDVKKGDTVISGAINKNGLLEIEVSNSFENSTVSKILELVEEASSKKADAEKLITKFARVYTPIVVGIALLIAIIPSLILGDFSTWLYRALIFLVISCPCALVVSIPLSFFSGIGAASKKGVLVKGGNYLEAINKVKTVVFDKTGTLTYGNFRVTDIIRNSNLTKQEVLEIAAAAEKHSNHPIAQSIVGEYSGEILEDDIQDYIEIEGKGVSVVYKGNNILAGNSKLMKDKGVDFKEAETYGTVVYIAKNKKSLGAILIADVVKKDSKKAILELKNLGITSYMLTGDNKIVAEAVGKKLGIKYIYSELLPQDKATHLTKIKQDNKGSVIFVGDGINDAPVLALSDVGVAMGGVGSDAAIEAADVVLMTDEPTKLIDAFSVAKKTRSIVFQNIVLALGVKIVVMILGVGGIATMWEAIFADVGVSLLAVLNASRMIRK